MKSIKLILTMTMGAMLLVSAPVFAAAQKCYSDSELKDFKKIYIELQQKLNYEGKDAYLDKNSKVQLRPHDKNTPYGGREFEDALFAEYQNSMRKVGKLYQAAKFDGDDNFKSNAELVKFFAAIDDKKSDSADYINKTKVQDVIKALEAASIKKFGNSPDKKFVLNAGDKYLLEKLLTHAQDRVCSISTFDETGKGTKLFKADYLQKVKNAPLNRLIATIKTSTIDKDSKIDLKETSALTANLVDPTLATKSAVAENLQHLSDWVKKVKGRGLDCLVAIKSKNFTNQIQNNIQNCNFGRMIDTLSEQNYNNLESVLHYINANERLLNNPVALAETALDEVKLEGFIGKTFNNLEKEIRCTELLPTDEATGKKVFIRNLPYDEATNQFQTSNILCKFKNKVQTDEFCKKQFILVSDDLGRGLELKPKNPKNNIIFSVKENTQCSNIVFNDPDADEALAKDKDPKKKIDTIVLTDDSVDSAKKDPLKKPGVEVTPPVKDPSKDIVVDTPVVPQKDPKKDVPVVTPEVPQKLSKLQCEQKANAATENGKKPFVKLFYNALKNTCDVALTQADCDNQSRAQQFMKNKKNAQANSSLDPVENSPSLSLGHSGKTNSPGNFSLSNPKDANAAAKWLMNDSASRRGPANGAANTPENPDLSIHEDEVAMDLPLNDLVLNAEKNICEKRTPPAKLVLTAEDCHALAVKNTNDGKDPLIELVPSEDKKKCVPENPGDAIVLTQEKCDAKAQDIATTEKKPVIPLIFNSDKNTCDVKLTQEMCDEKAKTNAEESKKAIIELILNAEKNTCDVKAGPKLTQETCDQMSNDSTERGKLPRVDFVLSEDKKECKPKKVTQENCDQQAKETAKNNDKPVIELVVNAEKNICEPKKEEKKEEKKPEMTAAEKACIKKQEKFEEDNNGRPEVRFSWDEKAKQCKDSMPDEKEESDEEDEKSGGPRAPSSIKPPPGRFQPINVPGKQMYVLPGMP